MTDTANIGTDIDSAVKTILHIWGGDRKVLTHSKVIGAKEAGISLPRTWFDTSVVVLSNREIKGDSKISEMIER